MSAKFGQMVDPWGPLSKVAIIKNFSIKFQDRVFVSVVNGYGISAP